jgi:hypothetical protein
MALIASRLHCALFYFHIFMYLDRLELCKKSTYSKYKKKEESEISCHQFPLVLLTPVANFPPVSTTAVASCHRYQQHRWQIMGAISGCRHLEGN